MHAALTIYHLHSCHIVFGTERYLKMKQMSDSQSSQPTAFMSQLMKLSNQSQVHFYMFYMFYNCTASFISLFKSSNILCIEKYQETGSRAHTVG